VSSDPSSGDAAATRPGRLLRWLFRVPVWVFRARLGWVFGDRFLRLTHKGRRSGRDYQTVLEVVRADSSVPEWTVVSGYADTSDWLKNLRASPAVSIDVGRRRFVPEQRFLDEAERRDLLADYQRRHPRAARQLGRRLIGTRFDGTGASIEALARRLPAVAFRPRTSR
jgi:deazaflavin-dependent oxidoreductase (nitroreductase family)